MYYPYIMQHTRPAARVMTVSGTGRIAADPDYMTIRFEVVTEGVNPSDAVNENAELMARVLSSLRQLGIRDQDIQTAFYIITPRYDYEDGRQIFRGYVVTNSVSVKVRDLSMAGRIIDTAVQSGVNQIGELEFGVENRDQLYEQALQKALKQAKSKAKALGDTMQLQVDMKPVKIIEEPANTIGRPQPYMAASAKETPIEKGQLIIEATVRAQFQY